MNIKDVHPAAFLAARKGAAVADHVVSHWWYSFDLGNTEADHYDCSYLDQGDHQRCILGHIGFWLGGEYSYQKGVTIIKKKLKLKYPTNSRAEVRFLIKYGFLYR